MSGDKKMNYLFLTIIGIATAVLALGKSVAYNPSLSFAMFAIANIAVYCFVFKSKTKVPLWSIILLGIIFRIFFINYPLSDDVNRYAWEGKVQNENINPYISCPNDLKEKYQGEPIFDGMNHPDVSTCYPPVAMLTFRAISSIYYSLYSYKIFFILIDIMTLFLLPILISLWEKPKRYLAIYAFNPIVLLYGAGECHLDLLHILFIVISLIFFEKNRLTEKSKFAVYAFLFLGTAVMTKYLSLIFLPFLITRKNIKYSPFFLIPFLSFLPFANSAMFSGLMKFSGEMSYNDVIPKFLRIFLEGTSYKIAMIAILGIGLFSIWLFFQKNKKQGMLLAYLYCLLCLPVIHIWYLIPLAIFVIGYPFRPVFIFFITIAFGFWTMHHNLVYNEWIEFEWVWQMTFIPLLIFLIRDWFYRKIENGKTYKLPTSIDIIIPTINEEKTIDKLLISLKKAIEIKNDINYNIIISDGGSEDTTLEIVQNYKTTIINATTKGRGNQIYEGIIAGSGDLIILLHSDSIVNENSFVKLMDKLEKHPCTAWGILGHKYDKSSLKMLMVSFMNYFRFFKWGIAFGDQGIFVRRNILKEIKHPQIELMEDVELSLRLNDLPNLCIGNLLTISTRRWDSKNAFVYYIQVITFVLKYLFLRKLGYNIKDISNKMYKEYYSK